MSLGGKKGQSTTDTRLEGISVNQSNYGNAVPLLYGQNRIPLMLLWYGNFIATPHTTSQGGGKGGGGGSSNTTFTYSASMIMGLGEGPMTASGTAWQDKVVTTAGALGLTFFSGTSGQAVWSYLTTNFPSQAVPYDHTAYMAIANLALGSSAAIPNYTFEMTGFSPFNTGASINDAEPSAILVDYCTDANHGAAFNALNTAQFQGAGVLTWQSYCIAMGFFISPYESTQRAASDFIKEILQITNSDCWMSAGLLNILPYADTSVTGNSKTYTPNLTPIFAFTDDDLRLNSGTGGGASGNDPIIVDRKPLADTYNTVVIEYLDRTNAYNVAIAQATDAQDIAINGVRVMSTLTFHSITTGAVAQQVAQLILQRQLYIRSTFTFSVRADYCLLEPMDLVSITDTALGINNKLVRIIEIDDDEHDNLTIVAEDMLVGSASAPLYNFQAAQGFAANYGVAPPAVATPLIFSAPPLLVGTAGGYETWIAVDQGAAGSWGGADVYMSLDGTSYIYAGTVNGAARYGTLTASLASHADPDTVDTLAVVLTNPTTTVLQLVTGSAADYNNLRTLLYVDGEIMAYQTATLTSAGHYNLTTLRRGQYGSSPALHAISSVFARIDAGIFRVPYDPGMIGQTIHFKFCSFNIFGKATQTLAAATDYTHVLSATNAGQMTPAPLTLVGRGATVNGNSAFKSGGTNGSWDSDVYSLQGYTNGAFVTFQPADNTASAFMIALNSDPTTDSGFTSLDYALQCQGNVFSGVQKLVVFNSGTSIFTGPTYSPGDLLSITYDGAFVRYSQNGAVIFQQPAPPNLTLYLDSSFLSSQSVVSNLQFGPYGTATPVLYVPFGQCHVSDENVQKQGGASAFDSGVYSINGYPTCHAIWKPNDTSSAFVIGISQNPVAVAAGGLTGIDFSLDCAGSSTLEIIEGGTVVATVGSYAVTDLLAITYDGSTVTYWQNSVSLRTVAISGKTYFLTASFATPGAACNSLEFGPGAVIPLSDSAEIAANAVSQIASNFSATTVTNTCTPSSGTVDTTVISVTVTTTGAPVAIDAMTNASWGSSGGLGGTIALVSVYRDGTIIASSQYNALQYIAGRTTSPTIPVTLSVTDAPAAGSHTYTLHYQGAGSGATGTIVASLSNNFIKVREIKK